MNSQSVWVGNGYEMLIWSRWNRSAAVVVQDYKQYIHNTLL